MSLNHVRPWRNIYRRKSRQIMVGNVPVGGDAPISVQTMTNTDTTDVQAPSHRSSAPPMPVPTSCAFPCPDEASAKALKEIVRESPVPIVADIHFHYKRGIEAAEAGAACLRINPGNIGAEERVRDVITGRARSRLLHADRRECRLARTAPAGKVRRAVPRRDGRKRARSHPHPAGQRFSRVQDLLQGLRRLPGRGRLSGLAEATDAPIHLGITEAGGLTSGTIKSAIGLGNLLWMGIGDTLRVSPLRRSGRGGEGRLRDPEIARPAAPRRQHHLLPVLRPAGLRRDQDGREAGKAARAHQDADVAVDHRLRRERPGRGADDRCRLHRRRRRARAWSISPASRATRCRTTR